MTIIANAKEIAELVKKLGDVELYRKIVELEGEIIELTRENHSLEIRVQDLTSTLTVAEQLAFKEPFYYAEGDLVPFCSQCWETDKIAVHVVSIFKGSDSRWDCPKCKQMYLVNC